MFLVDVYNNESLMFEKEVHKVHDVVKEQDSVYFLIYDGKWKYIDSRFTKPHKEVF